jgi:hypothetical protein
VNGTTYTQSGTYTSVSGCATDILDLTISVSTSNAVADSACDSYTWTVNGNTYTQTGTYTSVNGCTTEILLLDIVISSGSINNVSAIDSFFWSVNGTTYTQSGLYTNVNGCQTDTLILTISPSTGIFGALADIGGFNLQPNPAPSIIEVDWPKDISPIQLKMVDGLGKTHAVIPLQNAEGHMQLDVSYFPSGLYIAILESSRGLSCIRWMKQ